MARKPSIWHRCSKIVCSGIGGRIVYKLFPPKIQRNQERCSVQVKFKHFMAGWSVMVMKFDIYNIYYYVDTWHCSTLLNSLYTICVKNKISYFACFRACMFFILYIIMDNTCLACFRFVLLDDTFLTCFSFNVLWQHAAVFIQHARIYNTSKMCHLRGQT